MPRVILASIAGLLFGTGLTVSGMINPAKVLGFLDVLGDWDPSLVFVMAAAIPVAMMGFRAARRLHTPLCATAFVEPTASHVDTRLISGAIVFGLGWGLVGYCPGPALASLGLGGWRSWVFVAAMLAGMAVFEVFDRVGTTRHRPA
jgi:uncharacterized membrane protein YedE/YeeE